MAGFGIDHLVLTVRDAARTIAFYEAALGIRGRREKGRAWLELGSATAPQKINLHEEGREIAPHAQRPMPGAGDFCLVAPEPLEVILTRLTAAGVSVELGPVERMGAAGPMRSLYFRDPDGNLVEVCEYPASPFF
ncbi:Glyoxalase-like domain containing protein [Desulfovibrio sp. X2]|uniref:VOC family protein n=1 Tax=Desulfovibrio sp. X2 TaxID=941449 RepID=UPI00035874CB|nr:VOC family protein [Desulfovibrio sp. X2]EPR39367.1 Glyoxalase-like domain containing protein [Desulfovibrio sp. X2]